MSDLKFTIEDINSIIYGEGVYTEEGEELYEVISNEIIDSDQEKSSITKKCVIKEVKTGKFYKAELGVSPWYGQDDYNMKEPWYEVLPKQ